MNEPYFERPEAVKVTAREALYEYHRTDIIKNWFNHSPSRVIEYFSKICMSRIVAEQSASDFPSLARIFWSFPVDRDLEQFAILVVRIVLGALK